MEYFEIFGLPPRLSLDLTDLQRRFHDLSRQHHPDYHTTLSSEEQQRSVRTTALLNDAYRTLRDPNRRVEYLVRSHGLTIDGSKVPQALLTEVFEINEELEQIRTARARGETDEAAISSLEGFRDKIASRRQDYQKELDAATRHWDELLDGDSGDAERRACLERLADIIARSAYLRNLETEIEDEVNG